jgi:hypothetical protein
MSMFKQRKKPLIKASEEDTTWIPAYVEILRDIDGVATVPQLSSLLGIDADVAELRFRKLANLGWVRMSSTHDEAGAFTGYVFTIR